MGRSTRPERTEPQSHEEQYIRVSWTQRGWKNNGNKATPRSYLPDQGKRKSLPERYTN